MTPPVVLTVAGTDSGGAAGIAADLATFAAHGAHGACVVTAVTAQDTTGVRDVHHVPTDVVERQLDAVLGDLPLAAAKTGMLGTVDAVALVARRLAGVPLVVDPVLVATSGAVLGGDDVARAYLDLLLPVASVVTPNLHEARVLAGRDGPADELAAALACRTPAVIVTGGGAGAVCTDWVAAGGAPTPLSHPAVVTANDHGTGCTFSAALAVHLARGTALAGACAAAAAYTAGQLRRSAGWSLGRGRGPIAHTSGHRHIPHRFGEDT